MAKQQNKNQREHLGQIISMINSGGLNVAEYWCCMFAKNAESVRLRLGNDVMEDEDISVAMRLAFPGRNSEVFSQVAYVRARYNRGALTCQKGKAPEVKVYRYVHMGNGGAQRISARGRLEGDLLPGKSRFKTGPEDD